MGDQQGSTKDTWKEVRGTVSDSQKQENSLNSTTAAPIAVGCAQRTEDGGDERGAKRCALCHFLCTCEDKTLALGTQHDKAALSVSRINKKRCARRSHIHPVTLKKCG